ncbi:Aromatic-ring hydroxylase [Fusarium pseudocircinatum]|uniref:Aromatic-ring hydroxylase n=1 Tax=Fusarium pseudocircinatum TaxID=56676 RepID=A0A8H5PB77_9HYPO|nr:Aromatic-ring hydroxylase [Fusarium pseudocircinatum]
MTAEEAHFLERKSIIVAGAGMAGLAFAISLSKRWSQKVSPPMITVYDRDSRHPDLQRQGYSLAINGMERDGGVQILERLGLLHRVIEKATPGTDSMPFKIWDRNWNELIAVPAKPYGNLPVARLRIPRASLREIMIEEAEDLGISIQWQSQCLDVKLLNDSRLSVTVSSQNESEHLIDCDLLIAADGAHSKIRASLRPDDRLHYAGATQIGGLAVFPQGIPNPLADSWGIMASGHGNSCFVSPLEGRTVIWAFSKAEEMPAQASGGGGREILDEVRQHCSEIAEPFASLINSTDPSTAFVIPARDKKPFSHEDVLPGVVFIGDSNHAVSPFAGNGANMALADGWDLAGFLVASDSIGNAVAAYDRVSVPRAQKTLNSSHWRISIANLEGVTFTIFRRILQVGGLLKWMAGR